MNDDPHQPRSAAAPATPLVRLAELAELLAGETTASRRFLGGLVAGALAGAALAGTSVLRRRRPADDGTPDRR